MIWWHHFRHSMTFVLVSVSLFKYSYHRNENTVMCDCTSKLHLWVKSFHIKFTNFDLLDVLTFNHFFEKVQGASIELSPLYYYAIVGISIDKPICWSYLVKNCPFFSLKTWKPLVNFQKIFPIPRFGVGLQLRGMTRLGIAKLL